MIDQMLQGKQPDMAAPNQAEQGYQAPPPNSRGISGTAVELSGRDGHTGINSFAAICWQPKNSSPEPTIGDF
jgi:hypothetical protein